MQRSHTITFENSIAILISLVETKMVDFNYVFFKILIDRKKFKLHINEGLDNIQYIYT